MRSIAPVQQRLRVCDACGAQLNILDHESRLADHFGGKMHLGMVEIREKFDQMREKIDERRAEKRRAEDEERQKRREHRQDDEDDDRNRDRTEDAKGRSRSRTRSRSRKKHSHKRRSRSRSPSSRKSDVETGTEGSDGAVKGFQRKFTSWL
uniref:Luc7-like protein 3 n=1 Tax=Ditylenchus dipsaci TaxID=166011 RepID=A0A915EVW7_9BILA